MQKEITSPHDLLDENGELIEVGYAKSLILKYDRSKIKAGSLRIKEWDYYLVYNSKYAVALTVDDNSYMGLYSVTLIDFEKPHEITKTKMSFMPKGKTNMPSSSKVGDIRVKGRGYEYTFLNDGNVRKLMVKVANFKDKEPIEVELELFDEPEDSMVIATPFIEKKTAFYYNQKIVGLKVRGFVNVGNETITFNQADSRAILDWGRGVWTYKNTWYWGAGAGVVDGKEVGFNIGYGFGDTTRASENMIFYEGKAHKLDLVRFNIPQGERGRDDYMSPWTFSSNDKRFEMNFEPIIDRHSNTSAIIISSNQHQVFGKFSGYMTLDNGEKIELKNFVGFAEKVINKW